MTYISFSEIILRLAAAAGFAFLLGLDREARQKAFGLRTHMLLCVGTAAFVLILMEMLYGIKAAPIALRFDPARVIQAIIIGIGFLGAGAIIRGDDYIHGATTSAGVWVTGAIGLASGLGLYIHAAILTGFVLFIVIGLRPLDRWLDSKTETHK